MSEANGAAAVNGGEKRKLDEDGDIARKKEKLEAGELLFSGATDWKDVGRKAGDLAKSPNTQWSPVRLAALKGIPIVNVASGSNSAFCMVVAEDGKVYSWGRNEAGQLGLGHTKDRQCPTLINELTGHTIVQVATGKAHSLFLTSEGDVLACGSNSAGQCGVGKGKENITTPQKISYAGPNIAQVACGAEFSMLLDEEGCVWSFGHPENGTLGHNDDGKFMQKANKVEFRYEYTPKKIPLFVEKDPKTKEIVPLPLPKIVKIACGPNHTIAIDDNFKGYSWGFGGYGRLGHAETGDELVPRIIKFLDQKNRGIRDVVCGAAFNMALSEIKGMVQMWGIYTTNKEANMYPKPVQDLSGWDVRSMACNTKGWLAAADDSVIGSMPSPCYGELANGVKQKSSSAATILNTLENVHVIKVGAGYSHSLFIVRNQTEKDQKEMEKFPVLDQSNMD